MPIPERYRRLWRRRLRRRPLLPFLLLATLAVDLVILFVTEGYFESPYSGGLLGGQIALLGVWVTHHRRGALARYFLSLVLLLLAMQLSFGLPVGKDLHVVNEVEEDWFFDFDLRPVYYVILLAMAALATLAAGTARLVCTRCYRKKALPFRLRFQISSLLWTTLIAAVLLSFGKNGAWGALLDTQTLVLLILSTLLPLIVILPIALLTTQETTRAFWLLGLPCIAVFLSMAFWPEDYFAYYTTYAAFLGAWLYLAGDRGPAPESKPIEEPVEPPPASIDLRA